MGYKYQHGRLVSNPGWRFIGTYVVWPWEWILRFQSPGKAHLHKNIFLIALASYYLHSCLSSSVVKKLPVMQETQETPAWSMSQEDPLEEEMATYSSILAWEIPWTEEPGGLQSIGLQRAGHNLVTKQKSQQAPEVCMDLQKASTKIYVFTCNRTEYWASSWSLPSTNYNQVDDDRGKPDQCAWSEIRSWGECDTWRQRFSLRATELSTGGSVWKGADRTAQFGPGVQSK